MDAGATYLGRLADFLSDDLPLVRLVLPDCVTEFYRLRRVSWEKLEGIYYTLNNHERIIPHLQQIQRSAYPM